LQSSEEIGFPESREINRKAKPKETAGFSGNLMEAVFPYISDLACPLSTQLRALYKRHFMSLVDPGCVKTLGEIAPAQQLNICQWQNIPASGWRVTNQSCVKTAQN
jgi:hypothetical protein